MGMIAQHAAHRARATGMTTFRALGAAATITALGLFAGCSGSASRSASLPEETVPSAAQPADGTAGGTSEDYSGSDAQGKPSGAPDSTLTQKVARTAQVSLTVTDVEAAATQLRGLVAAMGGQVTAENLVTRPDAESTQGPVSTIVLSVPADRLDSTLDQLKSVGTLTNRVISSEDVTTQVADVDSRVKTLNASIDRLRELSKKAGSIRELTDLEGELTDRISERDSLLAQQRALAGRVAQSPITVTLRTPVQASELETTGFVGGLVGGWNALLASSKMLMTVVGAVLPFAAVAAIVVVPLLAWRRRTRRRQRPAGGEGGGSTATDHPEPPRPEG